MESILIKFKTNPYIHLVPSPFRPDLVKNSEPLPFPLYSLHAGKSDSVHMPCGNLPLLMYWGLRERPLKYNRQCGEFELM